MRNSRKRLIAFLILLGCLLGALSGCGAEQEKEFREIEDFARAKIGILTGSSQELIAKERFPAAQRVYFSRPADMVLAVEQGKIDCYLFGSPFLAATIWENANVKRVEEAVSHGDIAFAFPRDGSGDLLREQLNDFLRQAREDGTLDGLKEKWLGRTEPTEHPDYQSLPGENGTIRLAAVAENKPLIYRYKDQCTGYEMELLTLFARQYGYRFEVDVVPFESVIIGMATGKYDMTSASLQVTAERAESVSFSDPYMQFDVVLVVRDDGSGQSEAELPKLEDLENGRIAVLSGTIWDAVAERELPNAERKYFPTMTDMFLSIEQGKVDAILGDRTFYVTARWEEVPVAVLEETVGAISCGLMLAKDSYDPLLLEQLNAFIAQAKEDGTVAALSEKWLGESEPAEHPDYQSLSGENGTLRIAVDDTSKPMTYRRNDRFTGFDVDLLTEFARRHGYRLEFQGMSFDALIPTVAGGKCDISACGTAITPERAESVTFSDCYLEVDGVFIVGGDARSAGEESLFERISEGFEKTFIREERWKLIARGVGVTVLISVCAAMAGTLLGLGLYLLSRSDVRLLRGLAKGIAKVYSRIIAGTPVVVILMILFYVVFGKVRDMSGIVVAIIGFTLTFGSFVYGHMTVSVNSVDRGQTEAAYALGYTKNKAFFRVVFPQAMAVFLPSYCGQAVELVKATAVVGYIAVNDLTKMGDIIRSNTYEAFFPLIATALIYFLLTWLLSWLLGFVKLRFEPRRRSREDVLSGVEGI